MANYEIAMDKIFSSMETYFYHRLAMELDHG